jgi:hypothetical protein
MSPEKLAAKYNSFSWGWETFSEGDFPGGRQTLNRVVRIGARPPESTGPMGGLKCKKKHALRGTVSDMLPPCNRSNNL